MKTLELRHLSPYLPYGLGFLHQREFFQLMKLSIPYDQNPMWIEGWNGEEMISVFPEGCEPILRPLSDLAKEIVNPTNPKEKLNLSALLFSTKEECVDFIEDVDRMEHTATLSFWETLFEFHFDVFELIDRGLAIDVNDLKS